MVLLLAVSAPVAANRYSDQLRSMSDQRRNDVFAQLMTGSGEKCGRVDRSFFRGSTKGSDIWNIRCTQSGSWSIMIGSDSSTRILNCAVNVRLRLTPCWTPL